MDQDLLDVVHYRLVHGVELTEFQKGFVAGYLHAGAELKLLERWLDRSQDEEPGAIVDDVVGFIERVNF